MRGRVGSHLRRNAVAYLALFVALGGTGYAASRIPQDSVGTRQLRMGAVTMNKIRPTTVTALRAQKGPAGARGPAGRNGKDGVSAAVAFAHIAADGTIVPGTAFNLAAEQVFKKAGPAVGIYCFRNLPFKPKTANVTSDGTPGTGALGIVTLDHAFTLAECPKPYDVEVQMLLPWSANTFADSGFFIVFN